MIQKIRLMLGLIGVLLTGHVAAQRPVLQIATGELPPYATLSRADKGVALSIVQEAFQAQGYDVNYTFLPWSRALAETKVGKWDGTAYWGKKPVHEADFLISDTVLTEQWVFVHRKDFNFDWRALSDLRPYRVAMVRDYTYTPDLWAMARSGDMKVENLSDDVSAIKLLLLGRVDLAPMERNVACDLLRRNFSTQDAARLTAHPKLMTDAFTTHLMLPRKRVESSARMQDFNQGLKYLKDSGRHSQLLSQVSCPTGWSTGK